MSTFLIKNLFGWVPLVNDCVYQTSFTVTNTENSNLADVKFFKSVIISSGSNGGTIYIYDSIRSTQSIALISIIDLTAKNYYPYNVVLSSGLTFKIVGITGAGSVNIQTRK